LTNFDKYAKFHFARFEGQSATGLRPVDPQKKEDKNDENWWDG